MYVKISVDESRAEREGKDINGRQIRFLARIPMQKNFLLTYDMKHTKEYPRCVSKRAKAARPMLVESWRTAVAPYAAAAGRCIIGAHGMVSKSYQVLYNQDE